MAAVRRGMATKAEGGAPSNRLYVDAQSVLLDSAKLIYKTVFRGEGLDIIQPQVQYDIQVWKRAQNRAPGCGLPADASTERRLADGGAERYL